MDFVKNLVLKENYSFVVADADGMLTGGEHGLYNRDTRMLARYAWRWQVGEKAGKEDLRPLVVETPRPDTMHAHYALIDGPSQLVAVRRTVTLSAARLVDDLEVSNTSLEPQVVDLTLDLAADFIDLFEARGWAPQVRDAPALDVNAEAATLRHRASDEVEQSVTVEFTGLQPRLTASGAGVGAVFTVALPPGESRKVTVSVTLRNPLDRPPTQPFTYETWRASFDRLLAGDVAHSPHRASQMRAIDDLRGLLLFTPEGPVPAAGIPWFVAAFGRDALLTAYFLLQYRPDVAAGTLRYLARWQAQEDDPARAAQPGKIMHELRFGELTRTGKTPHSPYYGSVDATALFLMLLDGYLAATGDDTLVTELRPHWEAALAWLVERGDVDGDGFIEFSPAADGQGLTVQSWKDSHDSMSHADGALAHGSLAVSEVQGYAYAAYLAAAAWYRVLGEGTRSGAWTERAERLRDSFHRAFWLDDLGTYALALDGDKKPLRVRSSDAGHLLWTGIVPAGHAARLVDTLMSPRLWSGWGLRTLAEGEARYNPVSYHNGSVWPHDTALFLAGLVRYGFTDEAARVQDALLALAAAQPDLRLPELVAGYARDGRPPVPYPVACRPQAWDAAALIHSASLVLER